MKSFRLECFKSRRRLLWLVVLAMACIEGAWMAIGLNDMSAKDRAQGYAFCLYQAPLLNAIVLPVLISVLASRVCDMEHKGAALKTLFTMQKPGSIFDAKFLFIALHMAAAILLQMGAILLIGRVYRFTEALPINDFLLFFVAQLLPSLFMGLLIQILSLRYINAFIPLVTGLIGGFLGLMSMFFSPWLMRLVPGAYFGLLSTVRMDWDIATRAVDYYYVGFSLQDCLLLAAVSAMLYLIGRREFIKREV